VISWFQQKNQQMNKMHISQSKLSLFLLLILLALFVLVNVNLVSGQENEPSLRINIDRQVGFSLGGRIQGTFQISANGPPELSRVQFLIDGQLLGEDLSAPYEIRLQTSNYSAGGHTLSAVGILDDGQTLESETLRRDFVSGNWVFFVLIVLILTIVAVRIIPAILSSRQSSEYSGGQEYGYLGGAICQRCHRPFRLHYWSPRLLVGRLQRCPYCGKWQLARRASRDLLAEAERINKESAVEVSQTAKKTDDEDRLSRLLEDSRFEDS
jgi:hypothetical protein